MEDTLEEDKTILILVMERTSRIEDIMYFIDMGYKLDENITYTVRYHKFETDCIPSLLARATSKEMWDFLSPKVYPHKQYFWGNQVRPSLRTVSNFMEDWECEKCNQKFLSLKRLEYHQINHKNANHDHFLVKNISATRLVLQMVYYSGNFTYASLPSALLMYQSDESTEYL